MTTLIARPHLFLGDGGELKELELYTWKIIEPVYAEPSKASTPSTPPTTDAANLTDDTGSPLTDESGSPLIP